jgi:hypothetical protein
MRASVGRGCRRGRRSAKFVALYACVTDRKGNMGVFGIPEWAVGVGFIILAVSIGKTLAGRLGPPDRLRGRPGSRRDLAAAVDELQKTRLDALEDVQRRLADLEERLDFAERMLAKQRDAERIAPPKH